MFSITSVTPTPRKFNIKIVTPGRARIARLAPDAQEITAHINATEVPDKSEKNDKYQYQKLRISYYTGSMMTRYALKPPVDSVIPRIESNIALIQKFYTYSLSNSATCFVNIHIKTGSNIYIESADNIDNDELDEERRRLRYTASDLEQRLPSKSDLKAIYEGKVVLMFLNQKR